MGDKYHTVAASQSAQKLGQAGKSGDFLDGILVIPANTSPGVVQIKDGSNDAITVFAGGASSISGLIPFFIPIGARSTDGAWQVTTGASLSVIAIGEFTG